MHDFRYEFASIDFLSLDLQNWLIDLINLLKLHSR